MKTVAVMGAVSGCASLGPAEERKVRNVVSSERFVQDRQLMRVSLPEPAAWVTADRLSASVQQTWMCRGAYREEVATTTITSHRTQNLGWQTMAGLGSAAAGGVALGLSPGLSNTKPEPSESSPRERALLLGGLGVGTGAVLLGHAVWLAVKASDQESEPVLTREVRAPDRRMKECGRELAGAGSVVARVRGREVQLGDFPSGVVALNLRANPEELCGDPHAGEGSAKLQFALRSKETLTVPLGEYRLKDCVAATTARRKLRLAETQLAGAEANRVAQAVKLVQEAGALAAALPASDPDAEALLAEASRVSGAARAKAGAVAQLLVKDAVAKVESGAADAVPASLNALEISVAGRSEDEARLAVYAAWGRRGARAYPGLVALLEGDAAARSCLERGEGCPEGLTRERWLEALAPATQAAADRVAKQAQRLRAATAESTKGLTAKTLAAFDEALAQAEGSRPVCRFAAPGALTAACQNLAGAESEAAALAQAREGDVRKMRRELAEKQRADSLKKTAARWRRHFAECAQLQRGVRTLEALSVCDGACQAVVSRMRAQRDRLRSFEYSEIVDDPPALQGLVDECNAAGCETCP